MLLHIVISLAILSSPSTEMIATTAAVDITIGCARGAYRDGWRGCAQGALGGALMASAYTMSARGLYWPSRAISDVGSYLVTGRAITEIGPIVLSGDGVQVAALPAALLLGEILSGGHIDARRSLRAGSVVVVSGRSMRGYDGLAIGDVVRVEEIGGRTKSLRHEMTHVWQYRHLRGLPTEGTWAIGYDASILAAASVNATVYSRSPLESQAEVAESRRW